MESAVGRICREGGASVTVNMMMRDMDLPVLNARDARRLEIVADQLPLFGAVQLAVDTTFGVSTAGPHLEAQRTSTGQSLKLFGERRRRCILS